MTLNEIDTALFFLINRGLHNSLFDLVMPFVTNRGLLLFLPFVLWAVYKEKRNILPYLMLSVVAIGIADGSGNVLKHIFERVRPCRALEGVNLLAGCGPSFSMPSNHALNSFAFALIFWPLKRRILNALLISIASAVAFSRVYVGVHYPSDVLAGAVLGIGAAYFTHFLYAWALDIYAKRSYKDALWFMLVIVSLFRIYYIITGPFELTPDEAQYWTWAQHPDWSYYSKGPMIAWLIYISSHLFGNNEFGVRAFAILLSALASIILFRLGREMYDERTGFGAAALVQIVPIYSVFGIFFTIDSPYMFFWILSLFLFWKAFSAGADPGRGRDALVWWVLLGLSTGMGMLSKYTMALFYFSGLLFMVFDKNARRLFFSKGPYISVLICLALFSPVIYWNAAHGWVTLKHTAGQAHLSDGLRFSALDFLDYIGAQLGVVTPVLFVLILIALWKIRKDKNGSFLFWFSVPTLIFFGLKSIQGKVQGNWAMAAYASGFIAVSSYYLKGIEAAGVHKKRAVVSAALIAVIVTAFVPLVHPSLAQLHKAVIHSPRKISAILQKPLKVAKRPLEKISGAKELGRRLSVIHKEMSAGGPVFVMSDNYQQSSLLSFYMEGNPVTYCLRIGRRMNQYDIWPGIGRLAGQNAIFTGRDDDWAVAATTKYLQNAFEHCDKVEVAFETRLHDIMKYDVFKCYHFRGIEPEPEPEERY